MDDLQPGLYFGLDENVYHSDRALSRSNLVDILDTPYTYWETSWMNPNRVVKTSNPDMEYGKVFHMLLFEPERFEKVYQITPVEAWRHDKLKITLEDYNRIARSIKVLRSGADARLYLSGGKPEVTIVYDDTFTLGGEEVTYRFRTRHDYFVPILTTDFKTTHTLNERYLQRAYDTYGYDLQMYQYKRSRIRFKEMFKAGQADVYGETEVDKKFWNTFMADEMNEFIFIFLRTKYPYPFDVQIPAMDVEEDGEDKYFTAVQRYHDCLRKYGTKREWPVCDGKTIEFSKRYGRRESN